MQICSFLGAFAQSVVFSSAAATIAATTAATLTATTAATASSFGPCSISYIVTLLLNLVSKFICIFHASHILIYTVKQLLHSLSTVWTSPSAAIILNENFLCFDMVSLVSFLIGTCFGFQRSLFHYFKVWWVWFFIFWAKMYDMKDLFCFSRSWWFLRWGKDLFCCSITWRLLLLLLWLWCFSFLY